MGGEKKKGTADWAKAAALVLDRLLLPAGADYRSCH